MKYNWMPILRTGTFTDKHKQTISINESDLDKIISNTDLSKEPQFVIEHPVDDSVGFGTIEKLKRVGSYLFALPKIVDDKFKAAVNSGKFPGRSVSLKKDDLSLRSIGFLPPSIEPAVSGLGGYAFSTATDNNEDNYNLHFVITGDESHFADLESSNYEFAKYEVSSYPFKTIQVVLRNIKNFIIEKFSLNDADQLIPEYYLSEIGTPPSIYEVVDEAPIINSSLTNMFSQNIKDTNMKIDLSKLSPEVRAAFEAMESKVNELTTNLNNANVELQSANTKLTETQTAQLRKEILEFCQSDKANKKIKPADREKFVNFLISQKTAGDKGVIEFSAEDSSKVQFNAFEFAKSLIESLPNVIDNIELATRQNAGDNNTADYQKTAKQIADYANK